MDRRDTTRLGLHPPGDRERGERHDQGEGREAEAAPGAPRPARDERHERDGEGEGTLGLLVNDPSAYADLKAVLGGAKGNRLLTWMVQRAVASEQAKEAEPE